jgi:hypothetical protein
MNHALALGGDFVTLRSQGGFATADGALGALTEVAAVLPVIYPDIALVLYAQGCIVKRFDARNLAWEPLPEHSWKCRSCASRVTLSPLLWFHYWSASCQQCRTLMRQIGRPENVTGVPSP